MNIRFSLIGLVLVAVGVLLLLGNLNLYHFDWEFVIKLWPLVFILYGLKFIFGDRGAGLISVILVALLLIFLFVIDAFGLNYFTFIFHRFNF